MLRLVAHIQPLSYIFTASTRSFAIIVQPFNALSAIRSALYRLDFCVRALSGVSCALNADDKPVVIVPSLLTKASQEYWLCCCLLALLAFYAHISVLGSWFSYLSFTPSLYHSVTIFLLFLFYFVSPLFKWTFSFDFACFTRLPQVQTNTRTHLLVSLIAPPTQFSHPFAHIHLKMSSSYRSCHVPLITWVYICRICRTLMTLNWCLITSSLVACRSRRRLCILFCHLMFSIFVLASASTLHCLTGICRNWQAAVGNWLAVSLLRLTTYLYVCMFICPTASLSTSRGSISLTVHTVRFRRVNVYVCHF